MSNGRPLRLFGHPLHPAIVHFPMALLALPLPLDLAGWATDDAFWWIGSRACLGLGLVTALLAMLAGMVDLASIPGNSIAAAVANRHLSVMLLATGLFAVDGWLRLDMAVPSGATRVVAVGLSAGGLVALLVGGWMGGELVYRHRVGQTGEGGSRSPREEG